MRSLESAVGQGLFLTGLTFDLLLLYLRLFKHLHNSIQPPGLLPSYELTIIRESSGFIE